MKRGGRVRGKFDRGHLAPYAVMGGDRNNNGKSALTDRNKPNHDHEDEETLLQANMMTNIAPQAPLCFNQTKGVWYQLERHVQDNLVRRGRLNVWVFAGTFFTKGRTVEKIGPAKDIHVPHAFFKVIVRELPGNIPQAIGFVFPHYKDKPDGSGCAEIAPPFDDPSHFKSILEIEALTGLDFFHNLDGGTERRLELAKPENSWRDYFQNVSTVAIPQIKSVKTAAQNRFDAVKSINTEDGSKNNRGDGAMKTNVTYEEQWFLWIIIAVICAGILGGLVAHIMNRQELRKVPLYHSVILGVAAAAVVPFFLELISSTVLSDITKDNPKLVFKSLLVLFGFCTLAATISRSFLTSLSEQLKHQVSNVNPGAIVVHGSDQII